MQLPFHEIGRRIRAYRLGRNISSDELAEKIGVSRAAVYRLEKGMIVKIETIQKISELLNVSLASLIGVGVEYYDNALAFFERTRLIEKDAMRVRGNFSPVSQLLVSDNYITYLQKMILEGLPKSLPSRRTATTIDKILEIIADRRRIAMKRQMPTISIVSSQDVERMLRFGLVGRFNLSIAEIENRRRAARDEVSYMIELLIQQPIGRQIGVIDGVPPTQTFSLFEGLDQSYVALSPYRMSDFPNVLVGVGMVTEAPEAVELFKASFNAQWEHSHKGADAVAVLQRLLHQTRKKAR